MENTLCQIRTMRGITQEELSKRIGVAPSTISRLERGKRRLNTKYIKVLSKALNCNMSDLLGEEAPDVLEPYLIPIVGKCDGSTWGDQSHNDGALPKVIPVVPDVKRRSRDHSAYKITDNHTDIAPIGSYVVVIPINVMTTKPDHGDYLVVRRRHGEFTQFRVVAANIDASGLTFDIDGVRTFPTRENWPVGRVISTYRDL